MSNFTVDPMVTFTEEVGERIMNWIDHNLTFENGCKRDVVEHDDFSPEEVAWVFTQKGQKLYDSYVRRANKLIKQKFPNYDLNQYEDLESHTGVIYP